VNAVSEADGLGGGAGATVSPRFEKRFFKKPNILGFCWVFIEKARVRRYNSRPLELERGERDLHFPVAGGCMTDNA
jgi:hypothetical protein